MNFTSSDTIIVATKNKGKLKEFAHAFAPLGKKVQSMFDYPEIPDIVEDGDTFSANALKKAKTVAKVLGLPVLADDSGLCVDKLDGDPGVYSARYAGEGATDADNNRKLLDTLGQLDQGEDTVSSLLSSAQFVCVLVLYDPVSDQFIEASGEVAGWIVNEPRGAGGFGYDPLFYLPEFEKTMGEITVNEKQAVSHRGRALKQLMEKLTT